MPLEEITQDLARQALTGRVAQLSPSAVLALMEHGDVPELDAQAALRNATGNRELDAVVRAGAVRTYLHVAGADAVPTLMDLLGSDQERVAVAAATALGQAGTADQLEALRDLRQRTGDDATRQRAAFAEALIVHRFGVTDREVELEAAEEHEAPIATGALAFAGVKPGRGRKDKALKAIKRDLPWFDVGKQEVYEVQCGPRLLEVAVDRDFIGPEGAGKLSKRPATPTVIAMQDVEYDDFYPGLIGLSRPTGQDRVRLELTRLTGEPVYIGEGSVRGGEINVDLRAARAPGVTPVAGRIRLTAQGVEISGVSDRRSTPKKNPQKEE